MKNRQRWSKFLIKPPPHSIAPLSTSMCSVTNLTREISGSVMHCTVKLSGQTLIGCIRQCD